MSHLKNNNAFTLLELLTVITIIAILTTIILPVLNGAKKTARSLMCQSNLRSTGLAFLAYCECNRDYFPPAYTYIGGNLNNQPEEPVNGICHWSGTFIADQYLTEKSLHCPDIPNGGLAPQNTAASNLDPDQEIGQEGIIDVQASRCAFTVNEALCPRNRFKMNFEGTQKPSKRVRQSLVSRLSHTILLTEWASDWRIVAGPDSNLSRSYMPIHGFRGLGKMVGPDRYDLNMLSEESSRPCHFYGNFRKIDADDLSTEPNRYRSNPPRLDWVGRNHKSSRAGKNMKRSSFFYLDGHTEQKSVYETIKQSNFEWGNRVYSLTGGYNAPCY